MQIRHRGFSICRFAIVTIIEILRLLSSQVLHEPAVQSPPVHSRATGTSLEAPPLSMNVVNGKVWFGHVDHPNNRPNNNIPHQQHQISTSSSPHLPRQIGHSILINNTLHKAWRTTNQCSQQTYFGLPVKRKHLWQNFQIKHVRLPIEPHRSSNSSTCTEHLPC